MMVIVGRWRRRGGRGIGGARRRRRLGVADRRLLVRRVRRGVVGDALEGAVLVLVVAARDAPVSVFVLAHLGSTVATLAKRVRDGGLLEKGERISVQKWCELLREMERDREREAEMGRIDSSQ